MITLIKSSVIIENIFRMSFSRFFNIQYSANANKGFDLINIIHENA